MSKFESNIEDVIGASGAYFMYAAICGTGTLFVLFLVPETKGKSPEDMKAYFQGRKLSKVKKEYEDMSEK